MSQERTERDWTRDREIIAAIIETVHSPRNHDEDTANILCFAAHSVGRWPAALDEIDRLNAVIEEQSQYIDAINKSSDALDTAVYLHMCHIEQLQKDLVWEKAFSDEYGAEMNRLESELRIEKSKNSDLTAKVQERDKRMNELAADAYAASEACQSMSEEIERMREGFRRLREVPNGRRNGKTMMIKEIVNEYLKGAE